MQSEDYNTISSTKHNVIRLNEMQSLLMELEAPLGGSFIDDYDEIHRIINRLRTENLKLQYDAEIKHLTELRNDL